MKHLRYGCALTAAVVVTLAIAFLPLQAAPARANVLFIAVDDLRTNLGCYGDPIAITPNIDALAARGVRFSRAYCQQAVCNPSRQSLLTGRRPDTIRVWDLKTHFRKTSPGIVTLPEYFKQHGYFAQSFGKIFHGEAPMADPPSWSVPEQFEYTPKRDDYQLAENRVPRAAQKADTIEFVEASDDAYPDGQVAAAAVEALKKHAAGDRAQPFFLAVGIRKPHLPFTAPKRYWDLYDPEKFSPVSQREPPRGAPALALHDSAELRGYVGMPAATTAFSPQQIQRLRHGYYAATSYADAQIGRVLAALRETGLERSTIVVLWSDHGFHLGEHGLWAKTTNYEADTRVPLIMTRPGDKQGGAASPALVELLDIYPTLCELVDLPVPTGLEGRSLRPWLENPKRESRAAVFSQFPRPWIYRGQPDFMGYAVRTATHRYVEWRRFDTAEVVARELYAYADDAPFESVNLADAPAEQARVHELSALLPQSHGQATRR